MPLVRATAAATALTLALGLLGLLGPAGAGAALLLLPLPTLAVSQLGGVAAALAITVSAAAASAALVDVEATCLYVAFAGIPVVVATWALRRGWRIESVVATAVAVALVGSTGALSAFHGDLAALQASAGEAWRESFTQALELYRHLGMSEEQLADLELQRTALQQTSLSLAPAIMILCGAATWLLNLRLARRWASWPQIGNLKEWQAPSWLIWWFIVAGFGIFIPHAAISFAARNVFAVLLGCYFCQGLAIVSFYLQRLGLPAGLRLASYGLIAIQYVVAGIVLMLGVFDLWGDFRRLSVGAAGAQGHVDSE